MTAATLKIAAPKVSHIAVGIALALYSIAFVAQFAIQYV